MKRIKITIIVSIVFYFCSFGAYLSNVPISITQPDGTIIDCFATGDEFYNWAHDENGYTIIQDEVTGYYCYAILNGDNLIASQYIVGTIAPKTVNLQPYINISGEKIIEKVNEFILNTPQKPSIHNFNSQQRGAIGKVNNIVVYIRFADQTEFAPNQNAYTTMFNGINSGDNSMRNYFKEVSYNQLDVITNFYPINNGTIILSYQDIENRSYYCRYNEKDNPNGFSGSEEERKREHTLLYNAINYIKNQVPNSLNLDYNNDGNVDNVCFIVRGDLIVGGGILWPHQWMLFSSFANISINGKKVHNYNFQLETNLYPQGDNGTLCHEMNHTFGAPDLYHSTSGSSPVGIWDLMDWGQPKPQHMSAYMKYKYGGWISSIPSITTPGTYTLQPLISSVNNCYKIPIQGSSQYLVVEYRKKTGTFENSLPASGLIIYRINESYRGNYHSVGHGGQSDEVYVFRPGGTIHANGLTSDANFSETSGRIVFNNSTDPYGFIADVNYEDYANIFIKNIRENPNNTLSFDIGYCDNNNVTYLNTNNLPSATNAFTIQTTGTVTVKNTDNVVFEAGNEVILNSGFEIQPGG